MVANSRALSVVGWHFLQTVAEPLSQVVQDAQLRRFIVQQCIESRFGLACVCFDHVQLRYNVALKFDATFNVIVFPLDVGKRCAGLIRMPLREIPH